MAHNLSVAASNLDPGENPRLNRGTDRMENGDGDFFQDTWEEAVGDPHHTQFMNTHVPPTYQLERTLAHKEANKNNWKENQLLSQLSPEMTNQLLSTIEIRNNTNEPDDFEENNLRNAKRTSPSLDDLTEDQNDNSLLSKPGPKKTKSDLFYEEIEDEPRSQIIITRRPNSNLTSKATGAIAKFPTNATLESDGNRNVIIITPTGANAGTFSQSPVAIAMGMKAHPFNLVTPKKVRINRRRNNLTIELHNDDTMHMEILLKATNIGKFSVTCTEPLSVRTSSGVISPVELDISDSDLKHMLSSDKKILKVTRLPRFNKEKASGRKEPSSSVRIDFDGETIPDKVYIDQITFTVRQYNRAPLRCYNCQYPGHMSNGCTRPPACNLCAGPHPMRECTSQTMKCVNCKGPHPASSNECPWNKDAREIEKLRQSGVPFTEARRQVNFTKAQTRSGNRDTVIVSSKKPNTIHQRQNIQIEAEIHQSPGHYLDEPTQKTYASVTKTQAPTEVRNNTEIFTDFKRYMDQAINSMTIKLISFMQEVLSLQMMNEQTGVRKLLLINLAKHHFGTKIDIEAIDGTQDSQTHKKDDNHLNSDTQESTIRVEDRTPIIQMQNQKEQGSQENTDPPRQVRTRSSNKKTQNRGKQVKTNKNQNGSKSK